MQKCKQAEYIYAFYIQVIPDGKVKRMPLPKPRKKRTIALRVDLNQWIEEQIGKKKFQNFSHAIEVALEKLRDSEKEKKGMD